MFHHPSDLGIFPTHAAGSTWGGLPPATAPRLSKSRFVATNALLPICVMDGSCGQHIGRGLRSRSPGHLTQPKGRSGPKQVREFLISAISHELRSLSLSLVSVQHRQLSCPLSMRARDHGPWRETVQVEVPRISPSALWPASMKNSVGKPLPTWQGPTEKEMIKGLTEVSIWG